MNKRILLVGLFALSSCAVGYGAVAYDVRVNNILLWLDYRNENTLWHDFLADTFERPAPKDAYGMNGIDYINIIMGYNPPITSNWRELEKEIKGEEQFISSLCTWVIEQHQEKWLGTFIYKLEEGEREEFFQRCEVRRNFLKNSIIQLDKDTRDKIRDGIKEIIENKISGISDISKWGGVCIPARRVCSCTGIVKTCDKIIERYRDVDPTLVMQLNELSAQSKKFLSELGEAAYGSLKKDVGTDKGPENEKEIKQKPRQEAQEKFQETTKNESNTEITQEEQNDTSQLISKTQKTTISARLLSWKWIVSASGCVIVAGAIAAYWYMQERIE